MGPSQLEVIRMAMGWDPEVWLFGGFAEDALLYGKVARPHNDIDLLVWLDQLPNHLDNARSLGFPPFHARWLSSPEWPLALGSVSGEVDLEFCVVARTDDGRGYFDFPIGARLVRMWLPEDAFSYPKSDLDGVSVRTVSPKLLHQVRRVLSTAFGGLRDKDIVAQHALTERFFSDASDTALEPVTEML